MAVTWKTAGAARNAVTFMRVVDYGRARAAGCLLAVLLTGGVAQAAAPTPVSQEPTRSTQPGRSILISPKRSSADTDALAVPAVPKPTPARRIDLPAAFTKSVPVTLADLRSMQEQVEAVARRVSPAVVAVEVGSGSGSGVVISADGLVLTAGHVVGRPDRPVTFTFPNGKTVKGRTLGRNIESDTGLMKITAPGPWPCAELGDLKDTQVGDWVLALGNPGGFDPHRSLVVRLGRIIRFAPDAVQTDCTISPGDSGGPLLDMHGRVIAIHNAISTSLADNFHVPITEFYDTWDSLVKTAVEAEPMPAPRAYVGASGTNDDAGCRLIEVDRNSPASKAGLKVGDVVLKVNGRNITIAEAFRRWVAGSEPGETLNLEIKRGEEVLSLAVKLAAPPRRQ